MQITRFNLLLETNGDLSEHVVEVRNVDRLQAEVSGRQNGILAELGDAPMTWTTHWLWHACKRAGLFDGTWQEFKQALVEFEDASEGEEIPPTKAEGRTLSALS